MWYWILYLLLAIWVLIDAKKRKNNFIVWAIAVLGRRYIGDQRNGFCRSH